MYACLEVEHKHLSRPARASVSATNTVMQRIKRIFQHPAATVQERMRVRRAGLTGIATLLAKGTSIVAGLVSIPLVAKYLGTERFGLWLMLSTLLTWISMFDLGVANSLMNSLAIADGQGDQKTAKEAVSSAFGVAFLIAIVLAVGFLILYPLVSWEDVLNVSSLQAKSDARAAIAIGSAFFVIYILLSIPSRIFRGYQEGYIYQLWSGLGSALSIFALVAAIQFQASFSTLIATFFGATLLGDIFAAIHLFWFRKRWLKPSIENVSWSKSKWMFRTGFQFWIAQISSLLIFQTDLVVVAQLFGASAVSSYGVALKLFMLIGSIQSAFVSPLWSAYSEAAARSELEWITRVFKQSVYLSILWSLSLGSLLTIFASKIIRVWINQDELPSQNLILAMFFTCVLVSISQCIAMLANGLGEINMQVFIGPIAAITNLFLSVILGSFLGISGIAWATGICVLLFSICFVGTDTLKKLNRRHLAIY